MADRREAGGTQQGDLATDQPFVVSAPQVSLPKGGGAIRGIGEKFGANPVSGTGSMSVPIAASPGRSGFGPQPSLSYDAGAGNGAFGFGWSLSIPSITRKTEKGLPQYSDAEDSDVFVLSGAEDLVPVYRQTDAGDLLRDTRGNLVIHEQVLDGHTVRRYRPRIDSLFARIERWSRLGSATDVHWRSISKDNILTLYGSDTHSRIQDPGDASRIFSWLICETRDDKGNAVLYRYKAEDGAGVDMGLASERNRGPLDDPGRGANRYLKRIHYGNRLPLLDNAGQRPGLLSQALVAQADWMFELVFDYGDHDLAVPKPGDDEEKDGAGALARPWPYRSDPFSNYRSGFEMRTTRLCRRVLMFHHFVGEPGVGRDCLVRSTDLSFTVPQEPSNTGNRVYTFLQAVAHTGYRRNGAGYDKRSTPPLEFTYSQAVVQDAVHDVDPESLDSLPIGVDGVAYQWTDLHGEGIPGILTEQAGAWLYKRNLSPIGKHPVEFAPIELVANKPNLALAGGAAQFMDLTGDGQPDLVVLDGPMPGLFEHDGDEGWQPFRPFTARLNRDLRDPNLRFVDLDGDGHADILLTEDDTLVWHESLAEVGFGPARRGAKALDEEKGPRLVFADGTQSIYLADMSGDGLTDLVRIRNSGAGVGGVCYWPNRGYGRFGAKVTMDHPPRFDNPDQFDHKRIRLADIDGSGTTDIIYLHRDGVRLYFNQSGNGWSAPQVLSVCPRVDDVTSIIPTDLLGNGTACLVWSSPLPGDARRPMRYVNLMGSQKPHLLIKTVNNLGAETHVHYAPSTKFYLQDRRDGKPWITKLPFPVHVVERVETFDHISRNRFVTRYAYHHGYFDDEEREFRGFGMVEQFDTEQFAALSHNETLPVGDNVTAESHVPPVHTKTWFHTGIYLGKEHVSDFFAGLLNATDPGEYFREPGLTDAEARALLLPDTLLPTGLTLDEEREACRSLKGAMLRQEVYALDGSSKQPHPYSVSEQTFSIRTLQPRGGNRHGVFFTHVGEALTYHYERNPADPRIQHTLPLEVDAFGNVLKSAAIGYGRRATVRAIDAQGKVQVLANPGLNALSPADQNQQTQVHVTCTESRVTNAIEMAGTHFNPLPCETRTFELTGYAPSGPAGRFRTSDFVEPDPGTPGRLRHLFLKELAYEETATGNQRRRTIEWLRTLYRKQDLTGLLPLGQLDSMALAGESYKLAFTPGLLAQVFNRLRAGQPLEALLPDPAAVLAGQAGDRGGYVQSQVLKADGRFPNTDANDHWWVPSGRSSFSDDLGASAGAELAMARKHFFLPRRYRDPFGQDTTIRFDAADLLMVETQDALGNRVTVQANDYRVLQPRLVSDPNGNQAAVAHDILGMVAGTAVMGKPLPAPVEGDSLSGFVADLTPAQLDGFHDGADPHTGAPDLLQNASTRIVYDLDRFQRSQRANPREPTKWLAPYAATLARETHASGSPPPQGLRIQISFSHSDGFGREIQKKIQAEPEKIGGVPGAPRWVASGWTLFNNKGKPVRQYEPFFSTTHRFEFGVKVGVSPVLFYDPAERVVATLHPNHTWGKVVFDPWRQETWDVNDTVVKRDLTTGISATFDPKTDTDVGGFFSRLPDADYLPTWHALRTDPVHAAAAILRWPDPKTRAAEKTAAERAAVHAATPSVDLADSLGRSFLSLAHNRFKRSGNPPASPPEEEFHHTRIVFDIEGNQREVIDAKDRVVMRYDYDMLGNRIHQASMEAGARWMLNDVAGKPIRAWDSRDHRLRSQYDELRRTLRSFVIGADALNPAREICFEETIYGESAGSGLTTAQVLQANLRGKPYKHFDTAGVVTSEAHDFKGNLLRSTRQLVKDYKATPDWSRNSPPVLENEIFASSARHDALNRPVQMVAPHSNQPNTKFNVIRPGYNEANLLERVDVWLGRSTEPSALLARRSANLHAVTNIDYDAKGQRTRIAYGNGAQTEYSYDDETFRLIHLKSSRKAAPQGKSVFQYLLYTYDPAGNITHIRDDAQQTIIFNGQVVPPQCDYGYDAIYRLINATGREHIGQLAQPQTTWNDEFRVNLSQPGNGQLMRNYTEQYLYDAVGNFEKLIHQAANGAWTRAYAYSEASLIEAAKKSNRLSSTTVGAATEPYIHDAHGNMTSMPHLTLMQWDFKDQLRVTSRQAVNATPLSDKVPETTSYVYDGGAKRVRKVIERQNGSRKAERIYLGGFEIYREFDSGGGVVALERETLHVMDDKQRIALVETRTLGNDGSPSQLIRYQFGNHLGSASLELDDKGSVISYEEYFPYGSTSYQAVNQSIKAAAKRYRYTGKERDEETGFTYHGARYYAAWMGRWVSSDPKELIDGPNTYTYCRSNPVVGVDPNGTDVVTMHEVTVEGRSQDQIAKDIQAKTGVRAYDASKAAGVTPSTVPGSTWAGDTEAKLEEAGAMTPQEGPPPVAAIDPYSGPSAGPSKDPYDRRLRYIRTPVDDPLQYEMHQEYLTAQEAEDRQAEIWSKEGSDRAGAALAAGAGGGPGSASRAFVSNAGARPGTAVGTPRTESTDTTRSNSSFGTTRPEPIPTTVSPYRRDTNRINAKRGDLVWDSPQTLPERMAMLSATSGEGEPLAMKGKLGDPKYQDPGWVKMGLVVYTADGNKIEIHYMRNTITLKTDQFKFISRGAYPKPTAGGNVKVSPGIRP